VRVQVLDVLRASASPRDQSQQVLDLQVRGIGRSSASVNGGYLLVPNAPTA